MCVCVLKKLSMENGISLQEEFAVIDFTVVDNVLCSVKLIPSGPMAWLLTPSGSSRPWTRRTASGSSSTVLSTPCGSKTWTPCWTTTRSCASWAGRSSRCHPSCPSFLSHMISRRLPWVIFCLCVCLGERCVCLYVACKKDEILRKRTKNYVNCLAKSITHAHSITRSVDVYFLLTSTYSRPQSVDVGWCIWSPRLWAGGPLWRHGSTPSLLSSKSSCRWWTTCLSGLWTHAWTSSAWNAGWDMEVCYTLSNVDLAHYSINSLLNC